MGGVNSILPRTSRVTFVVLALLGGLNIGQTVSSGVGECRSIFSEGKLPGTVTSCTSLALGGFIDAMNQRCVSRGSVTGVTRGTGSYRLRVSLSPTTSDSGVGPRPLLRILSTLSRSESRVGGSHVSLTALGGLPF